MVNSFLQRDGSSASARCQRSCWPSPDNPRSPARPSRKPGCSCGGRALGGPKPLQEVALLPAPSPQPHSPPPLVPRQLPSLQITPSQMLTYEAKGWKNSLNLDNFFAHHLRFPALLICGLSAGRALAAARARPATGPVQDEPAAGTPRHLSSGRLMDSQ